jgi:predicted P-loop ATPase
VITTENYKLYARKGENRMTTVRDHLQSLKWDGVKRIDDWLLKYCGAEDTPESRTASRESVRSFVGGNLAPRGHHDLLAGGAWIVDIDMFQMGGPDADKPGECIIIRATGSPIPRDEEAPRLFIALPWCKIDLPAFWRDRDQLFAEAVASLTPSPLQ